MIKVEMTAEDLHDLLSQVNSDRERAARAEERVFAAEEKMHDLKEQNTLLKSSGQPEAGVTVMLARKLVKVLHRCNAFVPYVPSFGPTSPSLKDQQFVNKIAIIKAVREVTGLGLKESKDLVEQELAAASI